MVVRRRATLMGAVALIATALAGGYLWTFAQTGSGVAMLVGIALGVVAVGHGLAFSDARTPLLVGDETGLRVRLGSTWTGVPWNEIERVEVDERGRVTDGHVAVLVRDHVDPLAGAGLRSRVGALANRWMYDAPLVVPYGLTTSVSVVDVSAALTELAAGRTPVNLLDREEQPTPTVELTSPVAAAPREPAPASATPDPAGQPPGEPAEPTPRSKPRRSLIAARTAEAARPVARAASALRSFPARREEVTMPARPAPATDGTLALSVPYEDRDTEPLPEVSHLRRRTDELNRAGDDSNVSLIIDATTDLSARAMRKVRRPDLQRGGPRSASRPAQADADADSDAGAGMDAPGSHVGAHVAAARARLGLSVDDLADRTRIRPYVIESIEVDDFSPCGGDFYARGHLRMLSRVLGIDDEPLVTAYDGHFASSPIDPRAVFEVELATGTSGIVRGGASGANWGGLIAAVLVLLLVWGVARFVSDGQGAPVTQQPAATDSPRGLGSPGAGNAPLSTQRKAAPEVAPDVAHVKVAATGGSSTVVVKDATGTVVFRGILTDGNAQKVTGKGPLTVTAGNGGVVTLRVRGHSLGLMGKPGTAARQTVRPPGGHR